MAGALGLLARGYARMHKVMRTIADLGDEHHRQVFERRFRTRDDTTIF